MLIHLMQHGACLPKELDETQPLSPMGRETVAKTARSAEVLGLRFDLVVASMKVRSLQTAQIMAEQTGYPVSRIVRTEAVKAMASARTTIEFIKEYEGLDSILIAGHLPSLAKVASTLLTGDLPLAINIENAGLMQIDMPAKGNGVLNWYLSPVQLGLIATG